MNLTYDIAIILKRGTATPYGLQGPHDTWEAATEVALRALKRDDQGFHALRVYERAVDPSSSAQPVQKYQDFTRQADGSISVSSVRSQ